MKVTDRWRKAQKSEVDAWKSVAQPEELTERVRERNLGDLLSYTSLSEKELQRMRIVEIGGQVVENAFDSPDIAPKVAIDPLFPWGSFIGRQDKTFSRIRAVGECLPLLSKSMDLCWCTNTIDHTVSPHEVLREIRRVLSEHGTLAVSCNTFPTWTKPLHPLFNIVDTPHPHHFTPGGFRNLLKREFRIRKECEVDIWTSRPSSSRKPKEKVAALIGVRQLFFLCTPKQRS